MRSNAARNLRTEGHFTRDLAFKNERGRQDDGWDMKGMKKNQEQETKEIIVLECQEKASVVLWRRVVEEDGFVGEVLQSRSNFTLSN